MSADAEPLGTFWVAWLQGEAGIARLPPEEGARVNVAMRAGSPEFVSVTDIAGFRMLIRVKDISVLYESTHAVRMRCYAILKALDAEDPPPPEREPWETGDER